jgi:hypothetical protein
MTESTEPLSEQGASPGGAVGMDSTGELLPEGSEPATAPLVDTLLDQVQPLLLAVTLLTFRC